MNAMIIGFLGVSIIVLAPGCGKKCDKPMIVEAKDWKTKLPHTGEGIQCHLVRVCDNGNQGTYREALRSLEDQVIIDHGSQNATWCVSAAKTFLVDLPEQCHYEASPEPICLDVKGGSPNGPDYTGPTGGTLVTIGVGASSGDYYLSGDGTAGGGGLNEGAAGGGGLGGDGGAGGQGGI